MEDDGILATALQVKLETWGYKSPVAFTSQDAVKQFHDTKPDLVIMDITLKGKLNGIETADLIDSKFQTPIIYYSSCTDEELSTKLKNHRNRDYVSKTSADDTLRLSIEKHIKPKTDIVSENKFTVNITNKSEDFENFSAIEGDGSIDKNLNTTEKNVSNPDTHGFKPKNMTKNPESVVEGSTENSSYSSIETSQNNGQYSKLIVDDYHGSCKTIETELKKLESNFSKIFNESKSQHQDIVKLNNLVAKYKKLLCEKDTQIEELKVDRKELEEKVLEYKNQYQTVLNEMCSVKNQINKFIGTLAD